MWLTMKDETGVDVRVNMLHVVAYRPVENTKTRLIFPDGSDAVLAVPTPELDEIITEVQTALYR